VIVIVCVIVIAFVIVDVLVLVLVLAMILPRSGVWPVRGMASMEGRFARAFRSLTQGPCASIWAVITWACADAHTRCTPTTLLTQGLRHDQDN